MKLTLFTDYALRTLVYLGSQPERLCSIAEIAQGYGVSQNHLMKVVNQLARLGYVQSVRGRSGGIRLGRPAVEIGIGAVVRDTEDGFELVDCDSCAGTRSCGVNGVLNEALAAFLTVLDRYTLADMIAPKQELRDMLLGDVRPAPDPVPAYAPSGEALAAYELSPRKS